jgi:hypothetical protein
MAMGMSEAPHWVDVFLNNFNTSPYFIGLMMLTMNLGSRFLSLEMSKGQEAFFAHPWVRRFLIFVVFFIGTRNIWAAFWMAFIAIVLIGYLFNENSSLCLFKGGLPGASCSKPATKPEVAPSGAPSGQVPATGLTPEEANIFKQLQEKAAKAQQQQPAVQKDQQPAPMPDVYDMYKKNLDRVKQLFDY